jgi:hypothetical protein
MPGAWVTLERRFSPSVPRRKGDIDVEEEEVIFQPVREFQVHMPGCVPVSGTHVPSRRPKHVQCGWRRDEDASR